MSIKDEIATLRGRHEAYKFLANLLRSGLMDTSESSGDEVIEAVCSLCDEFRDSVSEKIGMLKATDGTNRGKV